MLKRAAINIAYPPLPGHRISAGLLIVRLLFGVGILLHGIPKLGDPAGVATAVGLPGIFGYVAVFAEIVGGAFIIIGALTPIMAGLAAGTMLGAIKYHMAQGDPFIASGGGGSWELAALYFAVFVLLVLTGPGRYSLDAALLQRFMRR